MRKTFVVFMIVLVLAVAAGQADAESKKQAEEVATRYVVALESGQFAEAMEVAAGAAASWVEYVMATQEAPPAPVTLVSCESAEFSAYHLVKVVFRAQDGGFGTRYVKVGKSSEGALQVTDDGKRGRRWASDTYLPGVMFKEPVDIDGLRVSVVALFELAEEVKFDIVVENTQDREVAIYPQAEAYYTAETAKSRKTYYYPIIVKNSIDGPVPPKSSRRGFVLFPSFVRDFSAQDPNLEGLKWVLYIPYGVDKQFAFSR